MRNLAVLFILLLCMAYANDASAAGVAAGNPVVIISGGGSAGVGTGGSVFNPFPFAGASAPLISSNTSVFNPFPLAGAAAPLTFPGSGIVTDTTSGSGSAAFFPNAATATAPSSAGATVLINTSPTTTGTVLNPFPFAGASVPLTSSNTSTFNPFPSAGAATPIFTSSAVVVSGVGAPSTVVLLENPEPASVILLGTGLVGLAWWARRRAFTAAKA